MIKPELCDIVELLVDLPEYQQVVGTQGVIVECFDGKKYEVEFTNEYGETTALCNLSSDQFVVVWQAKSEQWVSFADRLTAVVSHLSEQKQKEIFNFARILYQN